jgi:hypothetical protein
MKIIEVKIEIEALITAAQEQAQPYRKKQKVWINTCTCGE